MQAQGTQESTFDLNDFQVDKNYCLNDFLDFDKKNLDQYCFELIDLEEEQELENDAKSDENKVNNENSNHLFVQIKKKNYIKNGQKKTMLSIVDISKSIMYEDVHAQNEFLAITNATVSHELRNPLQSIDA